MSDRENLLNNLKIDRSAQPVVDGSPLTNSITWSSHCIGKFFGGYFCQKMN